jgi:S1-C subfamily serine protease
LAGHNGCFLDQQLAKVLVAASVAGLIGLIGWIGFGHLDTMDAQIDALVAQDGRPVLGLQVIRPDELVARMFSFPPGETLLVSQVLPNSAAERAGLQRGDGIVAVNGRSVRGASDIATVLNRVKTGDLLRLTVVRGGLVHDMLLSLAATPSG